MEPADLNPAARDDAHLEALLRRPAPLLADDHFATRVLATLPTQPPTASLAAMDRARRIRDWSWMIGATTGIAFAALGLAFAPSPSIDIVATFASLARSVGLLKDPVVMFAIALAAGSVFYALKPRVRLSW
jgi:hypothetical protein